jgi:hypothetical protein
MGRQLFYILELDASGMAWARTLLEADLGAEDATVAQHIRNRLQIVAGSRKSAVGIVDLATGQTLP